MSPEEFALDAAQRKDPVWTFYQSMTSADHKAFDKWLVSINHPLAYEAGTTWYRFQAVVNALIPAKLCNHWPGQRRCEWCDLGKTKAALAEEQGK